jgi:hypothetical protein
MLVIRLLLMSSDRLPAPAERVGQIAEALAEEQGGLEDVEGLRSGLVLGAGEELILERHLEIAEAALGLDVGARIEAKLSPRLGKIRLETSPETVVIWRDGASPVIRMRRSSRFALATLVVRVDGKKRFVGPAQTSHCRPLDLTGGSTMVEQTS